MPTFTITTNVPATEFPPDFLNDMSSLASRLCGKPEKYICINVDPGKMMTFGGTSDYCAVCSFQCIGKISLEENKKYTAAFMEIINRKLKIPVDRMYINFFDLDRENVGWNGTTYFAN